MSGFLPSIRKPTKSTAASPKKSPCAISRRRTCRSKRVSIPFGGWSCFTTSGPLTDFSFAGTSNAKIDLGFYLGVQRAGRATHERNGPGRGDRIDSDLFPSSGNVLAAAQVWRIRSSGDVDVFIPDRPLPRLRYDRASGFSKPAVVSNRTFVSR